MFQWKEVKKEETKKNTGGSEETVTTYSYVEEWSERQIDSGEFKVPSGHANPAMRYRGAGFNAGEATLGAYRLDDQVIGMLPVSQELRVDSSMAEMLREHMTGPVQAVDGKFYLGTNPSQPKIGDMRISYQFTPLGAVSIVAQQSGNEFGPFQTRAGDRLFMVRPGTKSAVDMFNDAQAENTAWTWIIRALGALVMFLGFRMILSPLVVVADVIPLIGNILGAGASLVSLIVTAVIAPLVIALGWLWYRPVVSVAVLAVGAGVAYGLWKLIGRRKVAPGPLKTAPV
jgi:Transmembrane protein 43